MDFQKISFLNILLAVLLLFSASCWAQSEKRVLAYTTATLSTDLNKVSEDVELILELKLDLKPEWHVYWENPGQSGMPPRLQLTTSEVAKIGQLQYFPPKRIFVSHLVNYGYENSAVFYLPLQLPKFLAQDSFQLTVKAQWLVCQEDCIPEEANFNFRLPITAESEKSPSYDDIHTGLEVINHLPTIDVEALLDSQEFQLKFMSEDLSQIQDAYVYLTEPNLVEITPSQKYTATKEGLTLKLPRVSTANIEQLSGFLETKTEDKYQYFQFKVIPKAGAITDLTLPLALLFAFLGGMLLNLMPCVFPILSLKVLSLCQQKSVPYVQKVQHAITYTSGILISFLAIAVTIISLRSTGEMIGWGFQMQSPLFLLVMIYVLVWVALVLFGYIHIWIPMPNGVHATKIQHPLRESFMTGLLITLVSTPCTAPFMAPALGFAFTQTADIIILLILVLGLGLAFPFILIAVFPVLAFFIPKSGPWLKVFKEFLAFPMLLTAIWLSWVLLKHISSNAFAIVLVGLTSLLLMIWLYKREIRHKFIKAILILMALVPIFYSFHFITRQEVTKSNTVSQHSSFSSATLDNLLSAQKKVFVNVTADWCINCKANEMLVLSTEKIQQYFKDNNITYLKADWTQQDETISNYLASFNRYGVPLYVYYPAQGEPVVLPQVLTSDIIFETIK